jgi:hypothetical protein
MANLILLMPIKDIFKQSRETYGSCRIQAELTDQGNDDRQQPQVAGGT